MADVSRAAFGRRSRAGPSRGSGSASQAHAQNRARVFLGRLKHDLKELAAEKVPFVVDDSGDDASSGGCTLYAWVIGPRDTPYEGYAFKLRVYLPPDWPVKSPSVAFVTKVLHVNIERNTGSICCNQLIDEYVSSLRLVTMIKIILPQLLEHPNADDPYNVEAARAMMRSPSEFEERVREDVRTNAIRLEDLEAAVAAHAEGE